VIARAARSCLQSICPKATFPASRLMPTLLYAEIAQLVHCGGLLRTSHRPVTVDGRVGPKRPSSSSPGSRRSSACRGQTFELEATGRLWPNPGVREGQVCASSLGTLRYAGSAKLEDFRGAELRMLATQLPRFATRQVEVPVMHARRPVSPSQLHQTAIALATGLIEPPEPADTILAPAPLPRCGAAGVCRAARSRLGPRSAWPHR
jgi:hypothetical protein